MDACKTQPVKLYETIFPTAIVYYLLKYLTRVGQLADCDMQLWHWVASVYMRPQPVMKHIYYGC